MNEGMDQFSEYLNAAMVNLGEPLEMLLKEGKPRQEIYDVMREALDGIVAHMQVHLREVDLASSLDVIKQEVASKFTRHVKELAETKMLARTATVTCLFPVLTVMFLLAQSKGAKPPENIVHIRQLGDEIIRARLGMRCPYESPMLARDLA